jgi:hypothetical protein
VARCGRPRADRRGRVVVVVLLLIQNPGGVRGGCGVLREVQAVTIPEPS